MSRPTSAIHAKQLAKALARSLEDTAVTVTLSSAGPVRGLRLYTIEVTIPDGPTLSFDPYLISNGAGGIDVDVLIAIRQAAGEEIADRPVNPKENQFNDIISYKSHFEGEA